LPNAFQHARAREIEAEIRYDHRMFHLLIRDDGKGIDPKVLAQGGRPGHWGLPGIRERAQQVGARVDFWSEAGAGTEIHLTIPANIAYEKSPDGSRFRLFRKAKSHGRHS
jgi:signal transduction histidine kinase